MFREAAGEVDGGRIAALDDTVLGSEEEVVEGAATDEAEQVGHTLSL
jgi:hypothetical protein